MFQFCKNEKGAMFPIAVALLFALSLLLSQYLITFESQLKTYNSLELVNVRATITILVENGKLNVES